MFHYVRLSKGVTMDKIFYFSGSGKSRRLAEFLGKELNKEIFDIVANYQLDNPKPIRVDEIIVFNLREFTQLFKLIIPQVISKIPQTIDLKTSKKSLILSHLNT